jgi:type I restriction enzyme S subunit
MTWKKVKLDILCKMNSGGTPSRKNLSFYSGDIPWAKISDIEAAEGGIVLNTEEHITNSGLAAINNRIFESGTLLLAMYGSVGKVAFTGKKMSTNQAILGINIKDVNILDYSYLKYWFQTIKSQLLDRAVGGTLQNISLGIVKELEIPLPPLATQKRIAEILDAADALRRKDQELLKKYDELAQAIFIDMFGDPVKNEKGWDVKTIRDIGLKISDGPFGSNLKTEHYSKEGVRVIRLKNIGINSFNDEDSAYINIHHYENVLKKHTCIPGDILIGTLGEPNLRACIFPSNIDKAVNKADCVMLRINPKICNQNYVAYLLNIPSFVESVANKLHGQTRTRISMGQVANLLIIIPPKSIQDKFSELITNLKLQNDNIKVQRVSVSTLFNSLIQKAFKGELLS